MSTLRYTNQADFARKFMAFTAAIKADPIEHFFKNPEFMDFEPTPAQTVALKCIFKKPLDSKKKFKVYQEVKDEEDGFDLEQIEMTEVEIYEFMTNRKYNPLDYTGHTKYINKIDLIVGRRGGKTTLSAMLAIYCAIIEDWNPYLRKTPFATVLILSHSKEFSDEVLELIRTLIEASPILKLLINKKKKNTSSTMNLAMPYINTKTKRVKMSRVQIKVGAASSKTTRGIAACAVLCDEIAFWNLDESLKETDAKILKAVRPAMKQFGRKALLIKLSSPGIKQGELHKEYTKWENGTLPKSYVVFKAPSWVWNTILPKEEFREEWELDEDGFNTEYRANFVDSLSDFINSEFVDLAVMNGVAFNPPEDKKSPVTYKASIDAAFKGDVFTFSVMGHFENRIKQYVIRGWEGTKKNPVKAFEVAQYVRTICKEYGLNEVSADQYAYQPLREIFEQFGITLVERPFNLTYKKKIYFNLKRLVHSQQIDLLDHEKQVKEMKELVVEQTGSGQIRIGHPPGGSDDYSDATAIAAYEAVESAGTVGFTFESTMPIKDYGIKTDINGRAFTAPSPEMLSDLYEYGIVDNSSLFMQDANGKLVPKEELEEGEDDDGINVVF